MDDDLSDLRNRQTRTERRVADLGAEVNLQAGLRAKMDKELGNIPAVLKAHEKSLNALATTQSEHTERLRRIEGKVDNTELAIGYLNGRMDLLQTGLNGRMDSLETGLNGRMDSIGNRMDSLETGLNGRMDSIGNRMDSLETGLNGRMDSIGNRMDSLETGLNGRMDSIGNRMDSLEGQMAGVKAGVDEILDRLGKD